MQLFVVLPLASRRAVQSSLHLTLLYAVLTAMFLAIRTSMLCVFPRSYTLYIHILRSPDSHAACDPHSDVPRAPTSMLHVLHAMLHAILTPVHAPCNPNSHTPCNHKGHAPCSPNSHAPCNPNSYAILTTILHAIQLPCSMIS